MTTEWLVDVFYRTIRHLGLIGAAAAPHCFRCEVSRCGVSQLARVATPSAGAKALGHSMGASLALKVEDAHPGTFQCIWLFEPPCTTPTGVTADR